MKKFFREFNRIDPDFPDTNFKPLMYLKTELDDLKSSIHTLNRMLFQLEINYMKWEADFKKVSRVYWSYIIDLIAGISHFWNSILL